MSSESSDGPGGPVHIFERFDLFASRDAQDPFSTSPVSLGTFPVKMEVMAAGEGEGEGKGNSIPESLASQIPLFCFPDGAYSDVDSVGKMFTFALTQGDGSKLFGFVRHRAVSSSLAEAMCIISRNPFFSLFSDMLSTLTELVGKATGLPRSTSPNVCVNTETNAYLSQLSKKPIPFPGEKLIITLPSQIQELAAIDGAEGRSFSLIRPSDDELPLGDVNYGVMAQHISSPAALIHVFASLLYERRILLVSQDNARLTSFIYSLEASIYPFAWQNIFCPILPSRLMDMASAPMPYIMGVSPVQFEKVLMVAGDVVVVNLDTGSVELPQLPYDNDGATGPLSEARQTSTDAQKLPPGAASSLERDLKPLFGQEKTQDGKNKSTSKHKYDSAISTAFRSFFVKIFGQYERFLNHHLDGRWSFKTDEYIAAFKEESTRQFVSDFITHTQMWERFIAERLDDLNGNSSKTRLFEREIADDPGAGSAMQEPKQWKQVSDWMSRAANQGLSNISNMTLTTKASLSKMKMRTKSGNSANSANGIGIDQRQSPSPAVSYAGTTSTSMSKDQKPPKFPSSASSTSVASASTVDGPKAKLLGISNRMVGAMRQVSPWKSRSGAKTKTKTEPDKLELELDLEHEGKAISGSSSAGEGASEELNAGQTKTGQIPEAPHRESFEALHQRFSPHIDNVELVGYPEGEGDLIDFSFSVEAPQPTSVPEAKPSDDLIDMSLVMDIGDGDGGSGISRDQSHHSDLAGLDWGGSHSVAVAVSGGEGDKSMSNSSTTNNNVNSVNLLDF